MLSPLARKTRVTRPTVGSARPKPERLMARNAPRPVWPMSSPTGSAMRAATRVASSEYWRCSRRRVAMPSGPDHWAPLVSQWPRVFSSSIMSGTPPQPGGAQPLDGDEGEQQGQGDSGDDRGGVVALEAVGEQLAEAAVSDVAGHADQGDRHDGGDPYARHDHRGGERALD